MAPLCWILHWQHGVALSPLESYAIPRPTRTLESKNAAWVRLVSPPKLVFLSSDSPRVFEVCLLLLPNILPKNNLELQNVQGKSYNIYNKYNFSFGPLAHSHANLWTPLPNDWLLVEVGWICLEPCELSKWGKHSMKRKTGSFSLSPSRTFNRYYLFRSFFLEISARNLLRYSWPARYSWRAPPWCPRKLHLQIQKHLAWDATCCSCLNLVIIWWLKLPQLSWRLVIIYILYPIIIIHTVFRRKQMGRKDWTAINSMINEKRDLSVDRQYGEWAYEAFRWVYWFGKQKQHSWQKNS